MGSSRSHLAPALTPPLAPTAGAGSIRPSQPPRIHHRLVARLGWPSLDSRLAAGVPPDDHPYLAARARLLVRPAQRRKLAQAWLGLVARAADEGRPRPRPRARPLPSSRPVPILRDRVLVAAAEIEQLCHALQAPAPVPVRGVALADALLRDGTGPVYSRRSQAILEAAVAEATRYLDPSEALA